MKQLLSLLLTLLLSLPLAAQTNDHPQTVTSSIPNKDAKFLLFPTKNNFNFLKLNTRTGEVYIVQYSLDKPDNRMEVKIESLEYPLVSKAEESNGRFYLYPTTNFFNFLLMDQIDGRVWQLQWGFKSEDHQLKKISNVKAMVNSFSGLTDSLNVSDLDYKDNLFYKDGELFSGFVYSQDKMVQAWLYDGRCNFITVYHFNKKEIAFSFKEGEEIPDKVEQFYDDYGNEIAKDEFIKKYPAVIRKAKEFVQSFNKQ